MTYTCQIPAVFCPVCHRYVGRAKDCVCGWTRPTRVLKPGEPLWQQSLDATCSSHMAPCVYRDFLFVGDKNGCLHAFDAESGECRWRSKRLSGAVRESPVASNEFAVVTTKFGDIVACDVSTGATVWSTKLNEYGAGAPTLHQNVIYIGDAMGCLHTLDLPTGRSLRLEPFQAQKRIGAAPKIKGAMIIVGDYAGYLYGVHAQSGRKLWEKDLKDRITMPALTDGRFVFVHTLSDQIYKLEVSGRRVHRRWPWIADSRITTSPALSADMRTLYVGDQTGTLYALDTQTADIRWRFQVDGALTGSPVLWEGLCAVGTEDGKVYALETSSDAAPPAFYWTFDAGDRIVGLTWNEGVLYAITRTGTIAALPWHLGQWPGWSRHFAATKRWREAAVCSALQGNVTESRKHFHRAGDFAAAAQMLKTVGERTEAAQDYRRAAYRARRVGDRETAADYYDEAADLFAVLRDKRASDESRREAVVCRRAPFIEVRPLNHPDLVVGETAVLQFELSNTGERKARHLYARLSGNCDCAYRFTVPELAPIHSCTANFEGVKPTQAGKQQLFRLLLGYESSDGRTYDYQIPLRLSVRAPEHPPVHIDEVLMVQGPMTRVEGDVGTVEQTGSGLVNVEGQVATVQQEGDRGYVGVGGDAGLVSQIQKMAEDEEPLPGPVARVGKHVGYVTQRVKPGVVEVNGEAMTVKQCGGSGRVEVGEDAGIVSQRVDTAGSEAGLSSFVWPDPMPGFTSDALTLAELVEPEDTLTVPQKHTAVILADESNVDRVGPGRYTRADFPVLHNKLWEPAPIWQAVLVDHRPFRMAFQVGPYRTADEELVGVRFIVDGYIPDDKALTLWHGVITETGQFAVEELATRLEPVVANVIESWLHERRAKELLPTRREREDLTLSLDVELRQQLEPAEMNVKEVAALTFIHQEGVPL